MIRALSDLDLRPTAAMAAAAKRGLRLRKKFGRGGTPVGWARAGQLARRQRLSPDTVRRMYMYFERHDKDQQAPGFGDDSKPSNGWIAWLLWGGYPGRAWARRKWAQIQAEREKSVQRAPARSGRAWWRRWMREVQRPGERRILARVRPFLRAQQARIIERVGSDPRLAGLDKAHGLPLQQRKDFIDDIVSALFVGETEALRETVDPGIREGVQAGFEHIRTALSGIEYDPTRSPFDQIIAEEVRRIDRETRAEVRWWVEVALSEGRTVAELQRDLQLDSRGAFSPERALRIARTEIGKAAGEGTQYAYLEAQAAGVDFEIEWAAAIVGSRRSHIALDGQRVRVGQPFTIPLGPHVGEQGAGPGQFQSAAEVVNCRCTTFPVLGQKLAAPCHWLSPVVASKVCPSSSRPAPPPPLSAR